MYKTGTLVWLGVEIRGGHIFAAYHQMVGFSKVSKVMIRVSVRIRVRFGFNGAVLDIGRTWRNI